MDTKKLVKLYHLKNDYNDYNVLTTDTEKIRKIYVDECLQCIDNNLCENSTKKDVDNARKWLYEAMEALFERDINYIVNALNKEHNWLIDTYVKES